MRKPIDCQNIDNNGVVSAKKANAYTDEITPQFIEALRNGDPEAFYHLVTRHTARLRDYALQWLDRHEDAEEAVQEVFLYLWEHRDRLTQGSIKKLYEYIYTAAKFQAIKIIREQSIFSKYRAHVQYSPYDFERSPDEIIIQAQDEEKFRQLVDKMPETRAKVFNMKYREGISDDMIAKELKISPVTVRRHISLAKEDLRKYFGDVMPLILILASIGA